MKIYPATQKLNTKIDAPETNRFSFLLADSHHVLHQLVPPEKTTGYNLRKHSLKPYLPRMYSNVVSKNFMYTDIHYMFTSLTHC